MNKRLKNIFSSQKSKIVISYFVIMLFIISFLAFTVNNLNYGNESYQQINTIIAKNSDDNKQKQIESHPTHFNNFIYDIINHPFFVKDYNDILEIKENDYDRDGLTNDEERLYGTDPLRNDTDNDLIIDGAEVYIFSTIPTLVDSDADGLADSIELFALETNPISDDSDNDNIRDGFELVLNTNTLSSDSDKDGLSDYDEHYLYKTSPIQTDSDKDGLDDNYEIHISKTNPLENDTDNDGLLDITELTYYKTNPLTADSDNDGLNDLYELNNPYHDPNKKDYWERTIIYASLSTLGFLIIFPMAFLSFSYFKSSQPQETYNTIFEIQKIRQNKLQKIFNLLQEISDHRKINVKILAQQVNCTEEEILQALNYFIPELDLDPTENINNDIIFETNTLGEKQDCCPYCLNSVPKNDKQCLSCGKRIIRCELCGKIIDPQKNKHAITSETITIRNAQSITQKVIKNYLCEKCMLRTRYNLV